MSTIYLTEDFGYESYRVDGLPEGTVIDATGASWIHDNDDSDGQSNPYPFMVYDAPSAVLQGGTINGNIDQTDAWRDVYDLGNAAAIRAEDSPNIVIRDWRIDDTWDGIRVSWNSPDFLIEDVWITDARDDAVENDRLQSGTIRDSLFDGVYAGMSIDPSSSSPVDGHEETVVLEGVLIRLEPSLYKGEMTHGPFIKTDSATDGAVTPNLRFIDCVFALETVDHRSYRSMFDAWSNTIESKNNVFLNLSDTPLPDDYPMPPSGWTILQGQEARDYWEEARDEWIARHESGDPAPADPDPADEPAPPTDEAPTDEAPTDEAPTDEAPTDETPTDEAPTDEEPTDEAPADEEPRDDEPSTGDGQPDDGAAEPDPAPAPEEPATDEEADGGEETGGGDDADGGDETPTFSGRKFEGDDGDERIVGNARDNNIDGDNGDDTILGGAGDDTLRGDDGDDLLFGGEGDDVFFFKRESDSRESRGIDTIVDFEHGDVIDVSAIDANRGESDDQSFELVLDGSDPTAGQLSVVFDSSTGLTVIRGNVDDDSEAELTIFVHGEVEFSEADFLL